MGRRGLVEAEAAHGPVLAWILSAAKVGPSNVTNPPR